MTSKELPDWFIDLLLLRATDGLDANQQQQFDEFVTQHPDRDRIELEAEKYELTVAAIDLGIGNVNSERSENSMPDALRQKVLDGAKRHFESTESARWKESAPVTIDRSRNNGAADQATGVVGSRKQNLTSREALAWLAAAAAVTLLLTGLNPFAAPAKPIVGNTPVVATPSLEEQFDEFLSGELADLVQVEWTATDKNSTASGEVVWRDSSQKGFMVFEGLRPNAPIQSQYQLWIFDANTGEEHPIDGGVFDIAAGKRTIIPIDARIPVSGAVMFAITEEKPGGVVVSDRKRLSLLAKVSP